jgi:Plasmid pRiA4b ORF-3-like protein
MKSVEEARKPKMIYRFRITLAGIEPAIWRLVEVPDCTLGELHEVLQVVMGWEDCHLHQFIVRGEYYGPLDPEDLFWDMKKGDEEEISISQVARMGRKVRFTYEYDFGDSWEHEIVLEKTLEPQPKVKYPRCLEGEHACPPEDVGGIWGYAEFLEAIADPKHKHHDDQVEWIGGKFDPEMFSVDEVNKELRRHF